MDLNELKNLNIDDLKAKVMAFADKKTLIKIGISLGSIIVFLIIYYAILNPIVNKKKAKISDMKAKQAEIVQFKDSIVKAKKKINDEIDAPIPNKYLWVIKKFFEKFPRKKTVSE